MVSGGKDPGAFKTIGELSEELGIAQHILRYWETKFPQLKPLQRAGNRRYYRPADVELTRRIHRLLAQEGYTIRGAQKALRQAGQPAADADAPRPFVAAPADPAFETVAPAAPPSGLDYERLVALRDRLVAALAD